MNDIWKEVFFGNDAEPDGAPAEENANDAQAGNEENSSAGAAAESFAAETQSVNEFESAEEPGDLNPADESLPEQPEEASQQDVSMHNPYAGQYPYGQQNGYPYTARQNNEPQNKNPYSQNHGGYPYQRDGGYSRPEVDARNPYAYTQSNNGKKSRGGKVVIAILLLILVGVLGLLISGLVKNSRSKPSEPETTRPAADVVENVDEATTALSQSSSDKTITADDTFSPTEIYKKILPSSVGILVYANNARTLSSEGSGVIWTEDTEGKYTYIVTCAHVISGAGQSIVVQLYNEKEYPAQIVGYDARTDIGVVRIEASGLQKIEIGDSTSLQVGDTIYAIGNPGGTEFANTFTNGIVTTLDRPVASSSSGYTMECIQHNAAINPGNSGGALVNEYGQLIGINSMKIVDDEYEGMGFAVPSSVFVDVMNSIIANGYVANRPKIGISYLRASSEQAYAMFVAIKGLPGGSIIIADVSEDSDFYGKLQKGDLVTAINGKDLNSSTDLAAMIEDMKVGDPITMKVVRIHSDYSFDETTVSGVLVEDRADYAKQEEDTTSSSFDDYFGDYFDDYFDDPFGGSYDDPFGFGNP